MPTYHIKCAEGCCDCYGKVAVQIPFINLDEEILDAISRGDAFEIRAENLCGEYALSQEQQQELDEDGVTWVTDDYSDVCAGCGSESSFDREGNRIPD